MKKLLLLCAMVVPFCYADVTQSGALVYVPQEIKECVQYLHSLRENETSENIFNHESISYENAKLLIADCRKIIAGNPDTIGEKNKKILEAYLDEYESFIGKSESLLPSSDISDEIETNPRRASI